MRRIFSLTAVFLYMAIGIAGFHGGSLGVSQAWGAEFVQFSNMSPGETRCKTIHLEAHNYQIHFIGNSEDSCKIYRNGSLVKSYQGNYGGMYFWVVPSAGNYEICLTNGHNKTWDLDISFSLSDWSP
jgi:hypothetical protein